MMGGDSTNINGVPRRLSKPRTKTSSTVLSSSDRGIDIETPSMLSDQQDYFGDHAAVVSSQGERRSRRKSRSRIRAYLYGSNSEATQSPSDDEDEQSTLAGAARDVRKRLSRTGSSIMQLQSAKASTARLSDASSSRLQLTGSQSSDAEESAMLADQIKERAYKDSMAAQNHVTSPVDEHKHVDSIMAPVRRKSLYTPGLATRNPSDILKKPPQSETIDPHVDRDYYYDPSKPQESPLSQLAALQLGNDGRSTPSNFDYPQLGGLQLGTLRVTNGIGSPTPRNRTPDSVCQSSTLDSKSHDEYFTASEGSVVGRHSPALPHRGDSPLKFESTDSFSTPPYDHNNATPGGSSPARTPDCAVSMAHAYISELDGSPFKLDGASGFRADRMPTNDEAIVIPQDEGPATEMWRKFIEDAEIRHGSNETQEDALRKLNGNNPPSLSGLDDVHRPSISGSISSRYSIPIETPNTDSGYGSKISLEASRNVVATNLVRPELSTTSQEEHHSRPQNLSSGFSSPRITQIPSNRSVSGPRDMPQFMSGQGRYSLQESGPPPLPYSFSVMPRPTLPVKGESSARSPTHKSVRKLQKSRPKSQPLFPIITGQGCRELAEVRIPRVPSIIAAKHAERLSQFPLLNHTFPSSQHTHVDEPISPNGTCTEVYPLPIRFPSPANALEAAAAGDLTDSYKPARREVSQSRARSKSRPCSSVVENGHLSHSRASSKDRHNAVGQMDDYDEESPASGIVRSPSWSNFGRGRLSKEHKRLAKQEREDEKRLAKEEKELEKRLVKDRRDYEKQNRKREDKAKSSRSRSTSRIRGRSADRATENEAMAIADFGTVTESLGQSPYDIATSMFPRTSRDTSNWHPHQISTAMPRPKSVVGMNEAAAAEAGRARSRTRSQSIGRPILPVEQILYHYENTNTRLRPKTMFVDTTPMPAVAAVDLKAHNGSWKRDWHQTRDLTGAKDSAIGPLDNCRGFCERSSKAQSVHVDVPPVPALPSPQQVQAREAQHTKSRPQSMLIEIPTQSAQPLPVTQKDSKEVIELTGSGAPKLDTTVKAGKTRASKIVPDLWTSGSLERKAPRSGCEPEVVNSIGGTHSDEETPGVQKDNIWEAQRQAWKERRKSAGEALLRNQISGIYQNRPATTNPLPPQELEHHNPTPVRAFTADPRGVSTPNRPTLSPSASFPNPLASHPHTQQPSFGAPPNQPVSASQRPDLTSQSTFREVVRPGPSPLAPRPASTYTPQHQSPGLLRTQTTFSVPRKSIGSGTTTPTKSVNRLTGRYDGGLLYGYEPGCGLGGSAGTRGAKTEASRKSIDVSRGFGLDLSDVPIFVAPATAGGAR